MDLVLYASIIRRFWLIAVSGLILALALSILSLVRISPKGIAYRHPSVWQSQTSLLLTQRSFPWGRAVLPANLNPSLFASLTSLYVEFANSDGVKAIMRAKGAAKTWKLAAAPVLAAGSDAGPSCDSALGSGHVGAGRPHGGDPRSICVLGVCSRPAAVGSDTCSGARRDSNAPAANGANGGARPEEDPPYRHLHRCCDGDRCPHIRARECPIATTPRGELGDVSEFANISGGKPDTDEASGVLRVRSAPAPPIFLAESGRGLLRLR